MGKLAEQIHWIDWIGSGPVDLDTDRTCDYINVANYRRGLVLFTDAAGTAGDDWNFTLKEATSATGTGVQDCDIIDEYWLKQAATSLLSTPQFTRFTQTADALVDGNNTSAERVCLLVLDLDFSRMSEGYNFLSATVTLDASGGAQQGAVLLGLYDARYPQTTLLGALS
ncbi:MAG: hypothetical protein JETCAE02_27070 [Anaerolineaceae bacterium]|nr:MAG: hypothetical protein JETCAE02_27070 [Anaerolineaceae bacterium]